MAAVASVTDAFRWLDLTGVLANAVLGGVIARSARLDVVGFATLAILSGLGGGIIRDTLLQHGTPIALTDYAYVLTALAGAAIAFLVKVEGRVWDRAWPLVDALALGCWAAAGAQKTLAFGLGWLPAVLLGTITAVGGGFVRDIVLRRVPGILGGNTLYATCALAASAVMVGLYRITASDGGRGGGDIDRRRDCACSPGGSIGCYRNVTTGPHSRRCAAAPGWEANVGKAVMLIERRGPGMTSQSAEVLAGLADVRGWQEDLYRDLHSHPELSHQEQRTAATVSERLSGLGYDAHTGIGGTGVVGVLRNGDGPTVLLRADMDALPVRRGDRPAVREHGDRDRRCRQRGAGDARLRARRARDLPARRGAVARRRAPRSGRAPWWCCSNRPRNSATAPAACSTTAWPGWSARRTWRWPSTCSRSRPGSWAHMRGRSCPPPTACASPSTAAAPTAPCRRQPSTRSCSPR